MTLTLKENEKVCEVLNEIIGEVANKTLELTNKGLECGEEQEYKKLMYSTMSLGCHEAILILLGKLSELDEQRLEKSQKLQRS